MLKVSLPCILLLSRRCLVGAYLAVLEVAAYLEYQANHRLSLEHGSYLS